MENFLLLFTLLASLPTAEQRLQALRTVLHQPNAQWRNEGQRLAVIRGLEWKTDVVVILPTGSGKSAIITTIAHLEKNTVTAVLCPLRSLLVDWQRRLDAVNFPYSVFKPSQSTIPDCVEIRGLNSI